MTKESNENYKIKAHKLEKALIFVCILLVFTIIIFSLINNSLSRDIEHYDKHYSRTPCGENEETICVAENEDYEICDTYRFEKATCVPENYDLWKKCDDGYFAQCIEEDTTGRFGDKWVSYCSSGEEAVCIEKNIAGRITSSGRYYSCAIGDDSRCE